VKLIKGYKSWVSQQEFRGAIVTKFASASLLLVGKFHSIFLFVWWREVPVTGVSAGSAGLFVLV